jgi:hypothetical protein
VTFGKQRPNGIVRNRSWSCEDVSSSPGQELPRWSAIGSSRLRRQSFTRLLRTVGVLMGLADDAEAQGRSMAFEQGLEREGWSLGQNLRIEYRYGKGDSARMQAFAKGLVELKPDCIVGHSTPVVTALMHATRNQNGLCRYARIQPSA